MFIPTHADITHQHTCDTSFSRQKLQTNVPKIRVNINISRYNTYINKNSKRYFNIYLYGDKCLADAGKYKSENGFKSLEVEPPLSFNFRIDGKTFFL